MTRKQMIKEIANQSGCSKRLVRKKLFQLSAMMRRRYKDTLFNEAFLSESTDWIDWEEIHTAWKNGDKSRNPWRTSNIFDVAAFPTGVNVLFRVDELFDGEKFAGFGSCGCRLYNFKGVRD